MSQSPRKRLAINLSATIICFLINAGINFILTPYIVENLGVESYGFINLANNIISYTSLFTIALNSMAGRFVTISYTKGDIDSSNQYFSSVFYSNVLLCSVICLLLSFCIIQLEVLFDIPSKILSDVRLLFVFLSVNTAIGLLCNVYSIATFAKNRLDLSSIRNIISNFIRGLGIFLLFYFFNPHIWYVGLVSVVVTSYIAFANLKLTRYLTPELTVKRHYVNRYKILELLKAGIWNSINSLGNLIGQGVDLIIANVFIGSLAMGIFSVSRQIPLIIIGVSATLSSVFAPIFTQLYAKNNLDALKHEINKAIRIQGFFVLIPLVFLLVCGKDLFSTWTPSQDADLLYCLTLICCMELVFSLPFDTLWNIFQVTNTIKYSTLFTFSKNILTFVIIIVLLQSEKNIEAKLFILASTRSILGVIGALTFSPLAGARCLGLSLKTFYPSLLRFLLCLSITSLISFIICNRITIEGWNGLIVDLLALSVVCVSGAFFIILSKDDRHFLKSVFFKTPHI